MKAMILAAGLGTRLRPLTDVRPKALVEINGRTLLEITLSRLRSFGVSEVIINVHHFADMVIDYLKSHNNFGMRIEISRENDLLLDTGGGLKKAAWFFLKGPRSPVAQGAVRGALRPALPQFGATPAGEPFLLHNVDVISNIDFRRMLQFHNEHHALATLAVQSRESSRLLLFNDQLQLRGRAGSTATPGCVSQNAAMPEQSSPKAAAGVIPSEARDLLLLPQSTAAPVLPAPSMSGTRSEAAPKAANCHSDAVAQAFRPEDSASSDSPLATRHSPLPSAFAFSGIHVISPRLLPLLTEQGAFSIIDAYLRLAAQGEKILAFRADEYYWRDLGRPSDLAQAALDLQQSD